MANKKKARKRVVARSTASGRFVIVTPRPENKFSVPSVSEVLREQISRVDRAIQHADRASQRIRGSTG